MIVASEHSPLTQRAREAKLTVASIPSGAPGLLGLVHGYDIVHTHTARAQTWITLLSPFLSLKRVATRHVAFEPRNRFFHTLKYGRACDAVIAVSRAVRDALVRVGVPADKITVIHTGIEIPENLPTAAERATARSALFARESDFVVGHMGAFTAEKGQSVAVNAMVRIGAAVPQAHLLLAGKGPLVPAVRKQLEGEPARVTLIGFVADRRQFFAALDLFIMPSLSEAWGLAALEAMAYAVPVIASNVGGLSEFVEGTLVQPGDPAALTAAIEAAAANPEATRAAGLKARERARAFSTQHTIDATEALYRQVLATRNRQGSDISGIG